MKINEFFNNRAPKKHRRVPIKKIDEIVEWSVQEGASEEDILEMRKMRETLLKLRRENP